MNSLAEIETVYRHRGADFFRFAYARTGDAEQARDAVQEGFARAIRSRRSFRGTGLLEAWVARCVINAAHDIGRDARRRELRAANADDDADGTETDSHEAVVRAAVRELPPRQRDALFLRFYLDFDYAAIADTLGVEVGTVSATLYAARASLAERLKEVFDDIRR